MPYFLKLQRNPPKNASIMESLSENLDKSLYFQRTVEIKQPHALTGAKKFPQRLSGIAYNSISVCCYGRAFAKGCVIGSGWCLISWNSKGIPPKVPQSWSPSAKIWISPVFSAYCRGKTTTCHDRALPKTAYVFTASRYAGLIHRPFSNGCAIKMADAFFLGVPKE